MIAKGIISAIYKSDKKLSVILPEYDNMTTAPLAIYGDANMSDYAINDFVVVLVFNNDFNDLMVLAKPSMSAGGASLTATHDGVNTVTLSSKGATLATTDDGAGNVALIIT